MPTQKTHQKTGIKNFFSKGVKKCVKFLKFPLLGKRQGNSPLRRGARGVNTSEKPLQLPLLRGRAFFRSSFALLSVSIFLFAAFGPSLTAFVDTTEPVWQGAYAEPVQNGAQVSDTTKDLAEAASFLVSIFGVVVGIEVGMIGALMDNSFIIGKGTTLPAGSKLSEIDDIGQFLNIVWRIMRDLVNYAFIIVLLIIAFLVVITANGGGENTIDIKSILPRFVIAVVLVNFTWFGAKVILDTATVATNIVYGIPQSIPGYDELKINISPTGIKGDTKETDQCLIPREVGEGDEKRDIQDLRCPLHMFALKASGDIKTLGQARDKINENTEEGNSGLTEIDTAEGGEEPPEVYEKMLVLEQEDLNAENLPEFYKYDGGPVILYFKRLFDWQELNANNIISLFAYSILNVQGLPMSYGSETSLWSLTVKSITAFIVMIIILVVFTTMFFVLLERLFIIWINIIFSPVLVLMWVLNKTPLNFEMDGDTKKMIGVGAFVKSAFLPAILGIPLVFGIVLIAISQGATGLKIFSNNPQNTTIVDADFFFENLSTIDQLFWYILAIVIMWQSMKLAESMAVTSGVQKIIGGIKGGVEGAGKFIAQTPLYAPWIPIAGGKNGKDKVALADPFYRMKNAGNYWGNSQRERMAPDNSAINDIKNKNLAHEFTREKDKLKDFMNKLHKHNGNWDAAASEATGMKKYRSIVDKDQQKLFLKYAKEQNPNLDISKAEAALGSSSTTDTSITINNKQEIQKHITNTNYKEAADMIFDNISDKSAIQDNAGRYNIIEKNLGIKDGKIADEIEKNLETRVEERS